MFAATVASACLFASIVVRQWGDAGRWPARAFALLASGPLFTGTYSYALGLAALLATLRALQSGRTWLAIVAAGFTLGFSPLAFVFLCLVLVALAAVQRRARSRTIAVAAGILLLAALQVAALKAFPTEGRYPFRSWELLAVVAVCASGALLAARAPRGGVLASLFALWAAASLVFYLVPSPVGENLTRPRSLVFPLMLLAVLLARAAPRWLAFAALSSALFYNVAPYAGAALDGSDGRAARKPFWQPALRYLASHSSPSYRVEVVPTAGHWEAYWVPKFGFALARGWYRQIDYAENRVLYRKPLTAVRYRAWLRAMGVRFVVLPNTRLGHMGAGREARLLRSGASGLRRAFTTRDASVYELRAATPILTGPGRAQITNLGHARIEGWTAAAGEHLLRVRYTPYWQLRKGALCLERSPDGMTLVRIGSPGRFVLAVGQTPAAIVKTMLQGSRARC